MTGITWLAFELVGKRLELLKEAVPRISLVAAIGSPLHPGEQRELLETQSTARAWGVTLSYRQVRNTPDFDAAFDTITKENPNALLVFADPVTNNHRVQLAEFAAKHRLPTMFGRKEFVEAITTIFIFSLPTSRQHRTDIGLMASQKLRHLAYPAPTLPDQ